MPEKDWGAVVPLWEICSPKSLSFDAENGVIKGVRILGRQSLNGREYTPEAITKAIGLYEGRPVNLDHPDRSRPTSERSVKDRFGWLVNVHQANDGLEGDLHYLKSHPQSAQIVEAAQRNPAMIGLSHNADGRTTRRNGKTLVEEIIGVRSVDLVADPATTKSLFESMEQNMPDMLPPDVPAPEPAAPNMTDVILSKVREILDGEGDSATKAKSIGTFVKEILKVEEKMDAKPEEKPAEGDKPEDKPTAESVDQLKATVGAYRLLEAANVEALEVRVKAVAASPEADRQALIESWPKRTAGEKARSTGPITESTTGDWKPPANAKEVAARLRKR
jgi:hypothetical protein